MENITTYTEALASLLNKQKDNKEKFFITLNYISNLFNLDTSAPFVWVGTKLKMKNELNDIFDFLHTEKTKKTDIGYDTWVDACGGALNSTLVLMESLKLSGVKNFIINDINECIVQTHKDIKDNSDKLIEEWCEIIREKFIKPYGTIFLEKKDFIKIFTTLKNEFYEYEKNKDYSYKSSIRFIILRDLEYSGTVKFNKDGTFKFGVDVYDMKRLFPWFFRQTKRIKKFSKIYNDLDIKIYNLDCFELLEQEGIKDNPNALINLDPPYIKQLNKSDNQLLKHLEDLKVSNNLTFNSFRNEEIVKKIKDCKVDYNQKFPHIDLLEILQNYNFIYNNNSHPVIDYSNQLIKAYCEDFDRKEVLSSMKNRKAKIVTEIILFKNSLI